MLKIPIQKLKPEAKLPTKAHLNDAGIDLYASEDITVPLYHVVLVPTSIALAIPDGYCGLIKDRSGVALKRGIEVVAGVIDAQYRGEIKIAMSNNNMDSVFIARGEKIAQMLILPVPEVELLEVKELDNTERGEAGFGSSGTT